MSAHIIGRPNDDLLEIMLGHGADPEQASIRGSEQVREEGDGFSDHLPGDDPTMPELWGCPLPDCARLGMCRTPGTSRALDKSLAGQVALIATRRRSP